MFQLLLDWLFPSPCPGCGRRGGFCSDCLDTLPPLQPGCPVCLFPAWPCPECQRRPPRFASLTALGPHEGILREGLLAFKYGGKRDLALPFGRRLGRACGPLAVDWVTSVPLHPERRRERGYDQSEILAKAIARSLHRPYRPLLQRLRATASQQVLGLAEREANLVDAFQSDRPVRGRILLIDDVFTSGATAQAACTALLERGASVCHVAVVARALLS